MLRSLKLRAKERICASPRLRARLLPRYEYNFTPAQLKFLCECLHHTRTLPGPVVEIGCAAGRTTIFLNQYLKETEAPPRGYICVDTFDGFPRKQVDYEVECRGQQRRSYGASWRDWSEELFRQTLACNSLERVRVIQADIAALDCSVLGSPSFCLIDVDLYLPVRAALENVVRRMPAGGVVVVDDCLEGNKYDGAKQAYREFVAARGWEERYEFNKLGVITIPTA